MDTKVFIEKLSSVFCEYNKSNKKFAEIWLSEEDFGGLYLPDKFVLNVKAGYIMNCNYDEISEVINLLREHAREELRQIMHVAVYGSNEKIHCMPHIGDILLYSEEKSC